MNSRSTSKTLPLWYDVDDVEGLRRLRRDVRRPPAAGARLTPHTPHYPAATAALLRNLLTEDDVRRGESTGENINENIAHAVAGGA